MNLRKLFIILMAAICCLFATSVASAASDAPDYGYRVIGKNKTGDGIVIEIGHLLYPHRVIADFGPDYKKSTGKDLTIQILQVGNDAATFPVCDGKWKRRGDKLTGGDVSMWKDCPLEKQSLGFVEGLYLTIPTAQVETAEDRFEKERRILASWNDLAAVEARVGELKASAGAKPAPAPVASAVPSVSASAAPSVTDGAQQPVEKVVPQTIVQTRTNYAAVAVLMLASGLGFFVLGWVLAQRKSRNDIKKLKEDLDEADDDLNKRTERVKSLEQTLQQKQNQDAEREARDISTVRAFARHFGVDMEGQITIEAVLNATNDKIQLKLAHYENASAISRREFSAYQSQEELANKQTQRDRARLAELEKLLIEPWNRIIEFDNQRTRFMTPLTISAMRVKHAKDAESRAAAQSEVDRFQAEIDKVVTQRAKVLTDIDSLQRERDEILDRLTGRPDATLALYAEAQRDRNDAAQERTAAQEDRAIAKQQREDAERLSNESSQKLALNSRRSKELDARHAALEDKARDVETNLDFVKRLLADALEVLKYDPAKMTLEEFAIQNGASGIVTQLRRDYQQVMMINGRLDGERKNLLDRVDRLEGNLRDALAERAKLEAEKAELQLALEEKTRRLTDAPTQEAFDALAAEKARLEEEGTNRESGWSLQLSSKEAEIRRLNAELQIARGQVEGLTAEKAHLEEIYVQAEKLIEERTNALAAAQAEASDRESQLAEDGEDLERKLDAALKEHEQTKSNLARANRQILALELELTHISSTRTNDNGNGNGHQNGAHADEGAGLVVDEGTGGNGHHSPSDRPTRTSGRWSSDHDLVPPALTREFYDCLDRVEKSKGNIPVETTQQLHQLLRFGQRVRVRIHDDVLVEVNPARMKRELVENAYLFHIVGLARTAGLDLKLPPDGSTLSPPSLESSVMMGSPESGAKPYGNY